MTNLSLKEAIDSFTELTETLQACIRSQNIQGAMDLAEKRHNNLKSVFENSGIEHNEKMSCAVTALKHLHKEQLVAKSNVKQHRLDFIARKSAYRAYSLKAA
jgi:short-subunit dehydrogenase involved in D-alanine esterification of teichoic acids